MIKIAILNYDDGTVEFLKTDYFPEGFNHFRNGIEFLFISDIKPYLELKEIGIAYCKYVQI